MLTCPPCSVPLTPLTVPVGVAAGCSSCGGVFLDDAAFGHFREKFYETILSGVPTEGTYSRPAPAAASDPRPLFACPLCRGVMTRTLVGEVEIDLCSAHGSWFDKNELVGVARSIAHARMFGTPSQSARPRAAQINPTDHDALSKSVANRGLGAAFIESLFADDVSLDSLLDMQRGGRYYDGD